MHFPYPVSKTEPEVFAVEAHAATCYCRWRMRLYWAAGDDSGSVIIDDDGRPFETIGVEGLPYYLARGDGPFVLMTAG